jgi:hypothetical protein
MQLQYVTQSVATPSLPENINWLSAREISSQHLVLTFKHHQVVAQGSIDATKPFQS